MAMGRLGQARQLVGAAYVARRTAIQAARDEGFGVGYEAATATGEHDGDGAAQATSRTVDAAEVPHGLRLAAGWSWRLLVLVGAAAVVLWLVGLLRMVFIPLAIALLLTALLAPAVRRLRQRAHFPRSLAAATVLVGGLIVVAATLTLVITQFVNGFPAPVTKSTDGIRQIQSWLQTGPLHLSVLADAGGLRQGHRPGCLHRCRRDRAGAGGFRVPFALPLAALVFLSSFVPVVGAIVSGAVAVLVALVTRGALIALVILIAVVVVQQLEGHVLQPLIMGRAVALHPLDLPARRAITR
jgi:hypothetical protein